MELTKLGLPDNKLKQLIRAGFTCVEDLYSTYPKRYRDRTALTGIRLNGEETVTCVLVKSVSFHGSYGKATLVKAICIEKGTGSLIHVLWFNQHYLYEELKHFENTHMVLAGNVVFAPANYGNPDHFECNTPTLFLPMDANPLRIYPEYKKVQGMSAEFYSEKCVRRAYHLLGAPQELLPQNILSQYGLIGTSDMMRSLHWPKSIPDLKAALNRKLWDDLIYFALRIELNYLGVSRGSPYNLISLQKMAAIRGALPFELTEDQASCLEESIRLIQDGRRLNALIQGDVGCGKTIISVLLMAAFAENGYQAALMAPTQILAQQHFDTLTELLSSHGFRIAMVSGQKLRKKEQAALEQGIADGTYQIVVGTQALLSANYQFRNLALVVEDEEHKYGVLQKQALTEKASAGTHMVTMTATPIPRTLARTIYGDNIQLFSIRTKPSGRLPVKTGIQNDLVRIHSFLINEILTKGSQAYVVCPMIAPSEKVEGVATAEETFLKYKRALEQPHGIKVALVTGKTKKSDAQQILADFVQNKISVLVTTTVIEVGVNVPNANTIVIHNAERFGLAQLHQLRGRVGRGIEQGWCVMVSRDITNPRLETMCNHTDGFEVAEMDLKLRGAGDLIGNKQSGTERYLALALCHAEIYEETQKIAKQLLLEGSNCPMVSWAVEDHKNNIGGDLVTA